MSSILGISAYYHDSAASIIVNGKIIAEAKQIELKAKVSTKEKKKDKKNTKKDTKKDNERKIPDNKEWIESITSGDY